MKIDTNPSNNRIQNNASTSPQREKDIPLDDIEKAFENSEDADRGTCSAKNDTVPPNLDGFLIQFIKNPFVLFLASIILDLSIFFRAEGAAIVSAIPVCGCIFAYCLPLKALIAKAIVSKGAIVSKSEAIVSAVKKVICRMGF